MTDFRRGGLRLEFRTTTQGSSCASSELRGDVSGTLLPLLPVSATTLATLDVAYLHVVHGGNENLLADIRWLWRNGLLVARGNRPIEKAAADIEAGIADIAPVGRWALANPDFVERYRIGAPLNEPDPASFYAGRERGYTDYPALAESPRIANERVVAI